MRISEFAVRRRVTVLMGVLVVVLLGSVSYGRLPVDLFPDFSFPAAAVIASYAGAGPAEVEAQVTRPIEQALATVTNVTRVRSYSQEGAAVVTAEFTWGTNMDFASLEMREKIDQVRRFFPGAVGAPMVVKFDPSLLPVMLISLSGGDDPVRLRELGDTIVRERLERLDGVAAVAVTGGSVLEVAVEVEDAKLAAAGVTWAQLRVGLAAASVNMPGGHVTERGRDFLVRSIGRLESLDELRQLIVGVRYAGTGQAARPVPVRLGDVARVSLTSVPGGTRSRLNGQDSLVLSVQRASLANTVQVASRVTAELDALRDSLPAGAQFEVTMNQAEFINRSTAQVSQSAAFGAGLATLVLLLFLRNLGSVIVVALAIPVSVIATMVMLYFGRLTLNLMTLSGLALGVGMLVDNSIVVLENITRRLEGGETPKDAAVEGTAEVANAITASTLTTVAVFLPVVFVGGIAGTLFRELALTVSFALGASLLVAVTFVPAAAATLLRRRGGAGERAGNGHTGSGHTGSGRGGNGGEGIGHAAGGSPANGHAAGGSPANGHAAGGSPAHGHAGPQPHPGASAPVTPPAYAPRLAPSRLTRGYTGLLGWAMAARWQVVLLAVLAMVLTYSAARRIGGEFMPRLDRGEFVVNVEMPPGTTLRRTDEIIRQIEQMAAALPEVRYVTSTVGSGGGMLSMGRRASSGAAADAGSVTIKLVPKTERTRATRAVMAELQGQLWVPGARITAEELTFFAGAGMMTPVEVSVRGGDLETLDRLVNEIRRELAGVAGLTDVKVSSRGGRPEVRIQYDRDLLAAYGLSALQVADQVRGALGGEVVGAFQPAEGGEVDVVLRYGAVERGSIEQVRGMRVVAPGGRSVRLDQVATVIEGAGPTTIDRDGGQRVIGLTAQVEGRDLAGVMRDVKAAAARVTLPAGYNVVFGGEGQEMAAAFSGLGQALWMAVVLVYMVMAAQFESLLHPLIIMLTVPLAAFGALGAMFLLGLPFSVSSVIGLILLAGIVVNNAIVLVDRINQLRARGLALEVAISVAGRDRVRPIMMTTLTTVLAMVPLAVNRGEGAEMAAPMAWSVIGGLSASTLLTLIVIPAVYLIVAHATRQRPARNPLDASDLLD
jgi:HAE1 family hydrophobic/amphiphilic exporter-1